MRKRAQYNKPKPLSKLPTLIIMILTLGAIILFGRDFSSKVAALFEPSVPVSDAPQNAGTQGADTAQQRCGSVIYKANTEAAQSLLPIISRGTAQ